jgi:hypothetical protein
MTSRDCGIVGNDVMKRWWYSNASMAVYQRGETKVNGLEQGGPNTMDVHHVRKGPVGKTIHIGPPPPPLKS